MSILNAKLNQFRLWLPDNFFYQEVRDMWTPIISRMKLPFVSLEDYMNSIVQSVSFPTINLPNVTQGQGQYKIQYRGGKELEPILDKNISINFKLAEGFVGYWAFFDQFELFIKYSNEKDIYWPSIFLSFIDHHGFELLSFQFKEILPLSMSQISLNYSSTAADFNTFSVNLSYNRYDIKRKLNRSE